MGFSSVGKAGSLSSIGGPADGSHLGQAVTSQQSFNQSIPQLPPVRQQISSLQKPIQSPQLLPPSLLSHPKIPASYSQMQAPLASLQQLGQPGFVILPVEHPSVENCQQLVGLGGQPSVLQPQCKSTAASCCCFTATASASSAAAFSVSSDAVTTETNLQASFQSSQQAFSQLQQQLQLMQPSNQGLTSQQSSLATKQQSQWAGIVPQIAASTIATTMLAADVPASKSAAPLITQAVAPWEKPEELTILEHQHQQKPLAQQHQAQSHPQVPYAQQGRQTQSVQLQAQLQTKLHNHQQSTFSSLCQASGVTGHQNVQDPGYTQLQVVAGSVSGSTCFQQGFQASQEWMWENN
ncbi:flowering time control protein FCA-like [Juglans microcarpa x Juglans regia]|uniref:flowering time control protein FCA-like n=1 Tax=Juglans microcarpa x Juglans regia TaxID=2249226 RepID=UPI001B7F02FC|nr:flowering time control protein FCA-like [Juglans microcarpa x Juglans regia]